MNKGILILTLFLVILIGGCATYDRSQGVINTWREPSLPEPVIGETTQAEIIEALGPPSQIIGLQHQTVFYYLGESIIYGKGVKAKGRF